MAEIKISEGTDYQLIQTVIDAFSKDNREYLNSKTCASIMESVRDRTQKYVIKHAKEQGQSNWMYITNPGRVIAKNENNLETLDFIDYVYGELIMEIVAQKDSKLLASALNSFIKDNIPKSGILRHHNKINLWFLVPLGIFQKQSLLIENEIREFNSHNQNIELIFMGMPTNSNDIGFGSFSLTSLEDLKNIQIK